MGCMGKFYSGEFLGRGYTEIREGRWYIKINLAPVCDSVTPMTRTDSSPAVENVKFSCEVCGNCFAKMFTKKGTYAPLEARMNPVPRLGTFYGEALTSCFL